ncbi:hypothetical protein T439DRAFT_361328 [Meredithblackwellia eburnea MCA 4105]
MNNFSLPLLSTTEFSSLRVPKREDFKNGTNAGNAVAKAESIAAIRKKVDNGNLQESELQDLKKEWDKLSKEHDVLFKGLDNGQKKGVARYENDVVFRDWRKVILKDPIVLGRHRRNEIEDYSPGYSPPKGDFRKKSSQPINEEGQSGPSSFQPTRRKNQPRSDDSTSVSSQDQDRQRPWGLGGASENDPRSIPRLPLDRRQRTPEEREAIRRLLEDKQAAVAQKKEQQESIAKPWVHGNQRMRQLRREHALRA